jgi:hypothetical protein
MLCPKCSQEIPDTSSICPNCGTPIEQPVSAVETEPIPEKKKSRKGLYIEIVIIIIILALIPVGYAQYQAFTIKNTVKRIRGEMNMLATGLEAYFIDACVYPSPGRPSFRELGSYSGNGSYAEDGGIVPTSITTPVSYITKLPHDPFRNNGKGYYGLGGGPGIKSGAGRPTIDDAQHDFSGIWMSSGWIVSSYGPDKVDGNSSAPGGTQLREELCWSDSYSIDTPDLMQCDKDHPLGYSTLTYDPSNGIISPGDVWRRGP